MDMNIVRTEIDIEDKSPKFSSTKKILEYNFNKELKIVLERCDERNKYGKILIKRLRIKEPKFCCSIDHCKGSFTRKLDLLRHFRRFHDTVKGHDKCVKPIFTRELDVCETEEISAGPKFYCPIGDCNKTFKASSSFLFHRKSVHEKFKYSCKNCGKEVVRLSSHSRWCLDVKKNYICPVQDCKSSYSTKSDLGRHNKIVHENFRYMCEKCGKTVINLKRHLENSSCNGEKNLSCTVKNCDSLFGCQKALDCHVKTVHEDPVWCPYQDCNTHVKPYLLKIHIRNHHEQENMKQCNNCGKRVNNLSQHFAICSSDGVKKLSCQVENCEKKFSNKIHLRNHVRTAHAARINCPHKNCGRLLKQGSLIQHLKRFHENMKERCEKCYKLIKLGSHLKTCEV